MKKKLLFVIPSLCSGGGEKSLINLLSLVDFDTYEVDLFLFKQEGLLLDLLPKEVNLLPIPETYRIFSLNIFKAIIKFILKCKFNLAYNRFMYSKKMRDYNSLAKAEQFTWRYIVKALPVLPKEYDAAIGYLEKSSIYFVVDRVRAKRKIGWIHTDYEKLQADHSFDEVYFNKLNHIVTVSGECKEKLNKYFSAYRDKILVINNIISEKVIYKMSQSREENPLENTDGIKLLTIARLMDVKGLDLAVKACAKIVKKGYAIKWYVIGSGILREYIEKLIKDCDVENNFILLGEKINPYVYIKSCDIYVQPSRVEGKSIAIDEAKILRKPVVVTNFPTVNGQVKHKVNGYIVEIDEEAIADGIIHLINNKELQNTLACNLGLEKISNEEEIKVLYNLL